jgi:predicted lipoprotein with Yx(FWY)xxD motif
VNRGRPNLKPSIPRGLACLIVVAIACLAGIATAWASGTTEVKLVHVKGGNILGQQKGYTLYVYCHGAANICTGGHSSSQWPPMLAYHHPVAGHGINQKKLGTKKIHGHRVVTFWGKPLYRFKGDKKPGQARGEAKQQGNGAWYVVSQFGQPLPPGQY